jgi:DNA-binding transcriptional regulator YiaG
VDELSREERRKRSYENFQRAEAAMGSHARTNQEVLFMSRKSSEKANGIGAGIKSVRERLQWSQEKLARYLDVSTRQVWNWEKGHQSPAPDYVLKIMQLQPDAETLEAFGVSLEAADQEHNVDELSREERRKRSYENFQRAEAAIRSLARMKEEGNRAAAEGLRALSEIIIRAAGIVTDPTLTKGRKKTMLVELLKEASRADL